MGLASKRKKKKKQKNRAEAARSRDSGPSIALMCVGGQPAKSNVKITKIAGRKSINDQSGDFTVSFCLVMNM